MRKAKGAGPPLGFGNDYVAPPLLGEYKAKHPQLDIELELSDNPNWASHHKWDIIIYIGALNDSSLKMITLAKNQRFICASPEYIQEMGVSRGTSGSGQASLHCVEGK